jgi:hypothetical protein
MKARAATRAEANNLIMENKSNVNIFLGAVALLALLGLGMFGFYADTHSQGASAAPASGGGFTESRCNIDGTTGFEASTTAPVPMLTAASASSTMTCYTAQAEQIDLNIFLTASSSSSCLQWEYSFSDGNTATTSLADWDWYYEDGTNLSSNVLAQEGASPLLHTWCGSGLKNITIKPTAEKYTKVEFKATGANSMVFSDFILKNILQN